VMLGTWNTEYENRLTGAKSNGSQTCEWAGGGFFMVCRSKTTTGETVNISGYSAEEKAYTVYIYSLTTGTSAYGRGWVNGTTWRTVFETEKTDGKLRRRQVTAQTTPTSYTSKWERSIEGEPWVVTLEGKGTKAK
jgi:hypothetical protein